MAGLVRATPDLIDRATGRERILRSADDVHGDAAFAGPALVAATLNLARCVGTAPAATINHRQTTGSGLPHALRFPVVEIMHRSEKMIGAPIFNVNGDDPSVCLVGGLGHGLPAASSRRSIRHAVLSSAGTRG